MHIKSFAINFPLSIDQICCNINHIKDLINGIVPFLQYIILMLHRLEIDDIIETIDSTVDNFAIIQYAKLLFAV